MQTRDIRAQASETVWDAPHGSAICGPLRLKTDAVCGLAQRTSGAQYRFRSAGAGGACRSGRVGARSRAMKRTAFGAPVVALAEAFLGSSILVFAWTPGCGGAVASSPQSQEAGTGDSSALDAPLADSSNADSTMATDGSIADAPAADTSIQDTGTEDVEDAGISCLDDGSILPPPGSPACEQDDCAFCCDRMWHCGMSVYSQCSLNTPNMTPCDGGLSQKCFVPCDGGSGVVYSCQPSMMWFGINNCSEKG